MSLSPAGPCSFPLPLSPALCSGLSQPVPPLPVPPPSWAGCATSGTDVSRLLHPVTGSAATSAVPWRCGDTGTSCPSCTVPLCCHTPHVSSPAISTPGCAIKQFLCQNMSAEKGSRDLLATALRRYSGVNYGCKYSERGISSTGLTWQPSFTVQPLTLFH